MKEVQVTQAMLRWLLDREWKIICYDFPQSGTGKMLHPNGSVEKNKKGIIPDIVAVRDGICIFSENKDRFYLPDYEKQYSIKTENEYSEAISLLLKGHAVHSIYYGIGLPESKHKKGSCDAAHLVDFILTVAEDKSVNAVYNPMKIDF
jgi:hypothetical protein